VARRAVAAASLTVAAVEVITMTEPARNRRPGPAAVLWGSIALFGVLFALLTYQLSAGAGSSLGGSASAGARPVQVRRVIKRRIVTTIVPTPGANTVGTGPVSSSSYSSGSEPVTTSAS
jgi:hypothetical protein